MNDIKQQRLKDIEDSLKKDYDLLKQYEELKRVEKDPRILSGYDSEIKRIRDDIKELGDECEMLEKTKNYIAMNIGNGLLPEQ
jgi:DNA repair exonuclease SbcCD ATPase subunit